MLLQDMHLDAHHMKDLDLSRCVNLARLSWPALLQPADASHGSRQQVCVLA